MEAIILVMYTPDGCFTNVSRALQNNLANIHNAGIYIYGEIFKQKICTSAQSMALGTRAKFQFEILIRSTIFAIHKFRENIFKSSRNLSETTLDTRTVLLITIVHIMRSASKLTSLWPRRRQSIRRQFLQHFFFNETVSFCTQFWLNVIHGMISALF